MDPGPLSWSADENDGGNPRQVKSKEAVEEEGEPRAEAFIVSEASETIASGKLTNRPWKSMEDIYIYIWEHIRVF